MPIFDTVIIGSGLSGLLCGYMLAKEGYSVCVLEKNAESGGLLRSFERNGHTFDPGIHYMGGLDNGQILERYFRYFGLSGKLQMKRMDENAFDIISLAGEDFPYAMGYENFTQQLAEKFTGEEKAIRDYCAKMQEVCNTFPMYNLQVPDKNNNESAYFSLNTHQYLQSITANRVLQNVLAGTNFNYAGVKEKSPFYIHSLITNSFIQSAWKPVGGSSQIADSLVKSIICFGGQVLIKSEVVKLNTANNSILSAELKNGEKIEAKNFISSIAPLKTIELTGESAYRPSFVNRIQSLEQTTSVFAIFAILKENSFNYLNSNYFYFKNKDVWSPVNYKEQDWPGNYMLFTPAEAMDCEYSNTLIIMAYMNYSDVNKWKNTLTGNRGAEYKEFKEQKAEKLLDLVELQFPGIRSKIKSCTFSTPLTYRDYTHNPEGSLYGILKDNNHPYQSVILPTTKIPNLFLTGQNTLLHGLLGVTIGSVLTCGEFIGLEYLINKINDVG
jgi:all-trans-retinol 13,14-reductase